MTFNIKSCHVRTSIKNMYLLYKRRRGGLLYLYTLHSNKKKKTCLMRFSLMFCLAFIIEPFFLNEMLNCSSRVERP